MTPVKKYLMLLFVLALVVRLACLVIVPPPPIDDSARAAYLAGAEKLVHGEGFRDPQFPVYTPPLYGMFIALCEYFFGDNLWLVKVVQIVIDAITVLLVGLIMRDVFDDLTGVLTAAIIAFYPFSIYLGISIASEPLVTCLLAAFVLTSIHAVRSQKAQYFAAAGAVLGLVTLTRGTTQFLPFLFFVAMVPFWGQVRHLIMKYALFCVSFLVIIAPWSIRNYVVLDDIIPVATGGGIVVLMGSQEEYLTIPGKPDMLAKYPVLRGAKPSQVDRYWRNAGIAEHVQHFKADPVGFARFTLIKFLRLWYATESGDNHRWTLVGTVPFYVFSCIGVMVSVQRGLRFVAIPLVVVGYYALLHWVSLPLLRYMMPVMPYVIGLAVFGVISFAVRFGLFERLPLYPDVRVTKQAEGS